VATQLAASQEGLSSMSELLSEAIYNITVLLTMDMSWIGNRIYFTLTTKS
jgi:hypothetical protein